MWSDLTTYIIPLVAGVVGWLSGRINRKVDSQDKLLNALENANIRIAELYEKVDFLCQVTGKRNVCKYLSNCPIDRELQRDKRDRQKEQRDDGQRCNQGTDGDYSGGGSGIESRHPP